MKINWGFRITVLYLAFVGLIVCLVTMAMKQQVDLVADDYYAQELAYQERIDMISRTRLLNGSLTWQISQGTFQLMLPSDFVGKLITGEIKFFRPSDEAHDRTIPLDPGPDGSQVIDTSLMLPGMYTIEITWEADGQTYFHSGVIQLH